MLVGSLSGTSTGTEKRRCVSILVGPVVSCEVTGIGPLVGCTVTGSGVTGSVVGKLKGYSNGTKILVGCNVVGPNAGCVVICSGPMRDSSTSIFCSAS